MEARRDGYRGIGMRKLFVATATVAIFGLLVSPALSAPGGNGKAVLRIPRVTSSFPTPLTVTP